MLITRRTCWLLALSGLLAAQTVNASSIYKGSAVLVIKPQYLAEFKEEVLKIIGPTRKEPENISYEAFQVLDDHGKETNRFEFHELWKSKRAMMIDHKEKSAHMKRFFSLIKINQPDSWVESFEVTGKTVNQF